MKRTPAKTALIASFWQLVLMPRFQQFQCGRCCQTFCTIFESNQRSKFWYAGIQAILMPIPTVFKAYLDTKSLLPWV